MRKFSTRMTWAAIFCAAWAIPANAQKSAYQSADGQTSLYLDQGAAATFNFGDTKFSLGGNRRLIKHNLIYGWEIYGKASSGESTLFSSKIKTPEGGGDFVFGWHPLRHPRIDPNPSGFHKDDWLLFDVGYSRSSFYVAPDAGPIDSAKRYFNRYRALAVYNDIEKGWFMWGAAAGVERRNNLDDLKPVTFQTTLQSASGNSVVKDQAGYLGAYGEYRAVPLYVDLLFIPSEKAAPFGSVLALDAFTRCDLSPDHRKADGGVGVFLTKKGSPTKAMGGVTASWNDGKVRVALVASYSF
jgi:hypothetical protein